MRRYELLDLIYVSSTMRLAFQRVADIKHRQIAVCLKDDGGKVWAPIQTHCSRMDGQHVEEPCVQGSMLVIDCYVCYKVLDLLEIVSFRYALRRETSSCMPVILEP